MLTLMMSAQTKHKVTVVTEPAGVGKISIIPEGENEVEGIEKVECELTEGQIFTIYLNASSIGTLDWGEGDYRIIEWKKDGVTVKSNVGNYDWNLTGQTMGNKDVTYTVVCKYDPKTPEIPNQNYFDKATGNLAVNDATTEGIEKGCNYRDYDKVKKLILFGKQKTEYFYLSYIMDKLPNVSFIDLSRATGLTKFEFGYGFYGSNHPLETLIIPACITELENTFGAGQLPNLKHIVCHATTPPAFTGYGDMTAFEGCPSDLTIHVPENAVNKYAAAEGWKRFHIVPLREEPKALTVGLPDNASDGRYKSMSIEVLNTKTGVKRSLTVSGRTQYIFENIMTGTPLSVVLKNKNGVPIAQMENVMLEFGDLTVKFEEIRELCTLSAKVKAPDGTDITDKAAINWADKAGKFLYRGSNMSDVAKGDVFRYTIVLPEELGSLYAAPANVAVVANQTETINVGLENLSTITVSGTVKDKNGITIPGATLTFSQKLNDKFPKSVVVESDVNGRFSAQIYNYAGQLTVTASRYYSLSQELKMRNADYVLNDIVLEKIDGATVSTELDIKSTQSTMITTSDVSYSAYNITTKAAISKITEQNGSLLLGSGAKAGDKVRITAKSISGIFADATAEVTIGTDLTATAKLALAAYGSISSTFRSTFNSEVVGMLYDANGQWLKVADYVNAAMTMTGVADGTYTLITMAKSPIYNKVSSLDILDASGLADGKSYASNRVTVKSGEVSTVSVDEVPLLNVSQSSYLSTSAVFESNKTNIVAGNYITLRGKALFADAYKNDVSNISMVVELPASAKFVEGSVMVGNEVLSSCKPTNGRIVIPVSNPSDLVRFCVIPTESGEYTPTAMAQFTYQGAERVQLIGNATYTVENLSISVPAEVARTKFRVAGAALANSEVSVYDGETLIGQTTTNAFGSWDLMVELQNPFNLSRHPIYAVVNTADGMTMKTETSFVRYDKYAIEVDYVNMTVSNHVVDDMHITFDYKTGTTNRSYYDYWGNDAFTFIVNLTNNDPALVKNVNVHVMTEGGGVTTLPATYVAHQDRWVAASYFNDNKPINVGVTFEADTEQKVDLSELYDFIESFAKIRKELIEKVTAIKNLDENDYEYEEFLSKLEYISGEPIVSQPAINNGVSYPEMTDDQLDSIVQELDLWMNDFEEKNKIFEVVYENLSKLLEISNDGEFSYDDGSKLIVKTCDGLDKDLLLAEGFEQLNDVEGGSVYVLYSEQRTVLCDFTHNYYFEKIIHGKQAVTRSAETPIIPKFPLTYEGLNQIIGYFKPVMESVTNAYNDMTAYLFELPLNFGSHVKYAQNQLTEVLSNIEKVSNYHTELLGKAEAAKLSGFMEDYQKYMDKAAKAQQQLQRIRNNVKSIQKSISAWKWCEKTAKWCTSTVTKKMPFVKYLNKSIDMVNDVLAYKGLYDAVPNPCEEDKDQADAIKTSVIIAGSAAGMVHLVQLGYDIITDIGLVSQAAAGIATLGASTVAAFGEAVAKCVASAIFDISYLAVTKIFDATTRDRINKLKCVKNKDPRQNWWEYLWLTPNVEAHGDPSGFVYEAVSSNRVEGVTASVYYKETYEDIYGDQKEKEVLWDAEKYAQENPQFTDADGMYCWMVPSGMWRVKFEKAGYETTHSEWLPVPPPQLDVNVPISQLTAPEVVQAHAYANSVEFKFDKYMIPSTLRANNVVKVTQNGSAISGTLTALNEEACYSGSDTKYASAFCFKASKAFDTTKPVTLTVTSSAQSYADIKMQEDYTVNLNIEEHLTGIETESSLNLNPGETKSIVVSVLPAATAKGKTLIVKPSTEAIASVDAKEYTLNANGQATVNITANSIGGTSLKFSVANYDVTARTEVNVVDKYQKVQAPKASMASGSMLPYLTPVTLSCSTPNSTILYTTDGSCPCDNGADVKTYEGNPIILTKNMTLKAMAVVKGMIESEVSEFSYSIDPTGIADVKAVDVKISPTITNDIVNVEVGNERPAEITVYNIGGQVVLRSNITHSATVSLAPQPDGIYFLSVSQDSAVTVEKIIKD